MGNNQAYKDKAQWRERFRNLKELEKEINQQLGHSCAERKLGEFIEHLIDKYGLDDVAVMVGVQIASAPWDGRYTKAVKEWAELNSSFSQYSDMDINHPRNINYSLYAHPAYINELAKKLIKKECEALLNKEYELVEVFDKMALYTDERISAEKIKFLLPDVPMHFYYVRGTDDDPGIYGTIEKNPVLVNHTGTILSRSPLLDEHEEYREVGDMDWHFPAVMLCLGDYIEEPENAKQKTNERYNGR